MSFPLPLLDLQLIALTSVPWGHRITLEYYVQDGQVWVDIKSSIVIAYQENCAKNVE